MKKTLSVNKETLDSLVYFVFGFTLDENYDFIIDCIVEKAYKDATNQGAFNTKADSSMAQLAKYGNNGKDGSKTILINRIMQLEDDISDFDGWHEETCDKLVEVYNDNGLEGVFTYGNAQKWVNMTLKYICLLNGISGDYSKEFKEQTDKIMKYLSSFHVPIDSFIIDIMWYYKDIRLPYKSGVENRRSTNYAIPSKYVKGWSNWEKPEYKKAIEDLRSIINKESSETEPIMWESEKWIIRAKERKR